MGNIKKYKLVGIGAIILIVGLVVGYNVKVINISKPLNLKLITEAGSINKIDLNLTSLVESEFKENNKLMIMKEMLGKENIEKEVNSAVVETIKNLEGEIGLNKYLLESNQTKSELIQRIESDLIYGKLILKESKVKINIKQIDSYAKEKNKEVPKKRIKFYFSKDKRNLTGLTSITEIKNLPKDVTRSEQTLGEQNLNLWNEVKNLKDGECSKLIFGDINYLIYNVATLDKKEQDDLIKDILIYNTQKSSLNKKIEVKLKGIKIEVE